MPFSENDPADDGPIEVWLVYGDKRVEGGWKYFGRAPVPPGDLIDIRDTRSGRTARALVTGYDPNEKLPIAAEIVAFD